MDKSFMVKDANQNIDVRFTQTRKPLEWYATIFIDGKRTRIGPAQIPALLNNVANFVRTEAAYSDLKVHGSEEVELAIQPRKRQRPDLATTLKHAAEATRIVARGGLPTYLKDDEHNKYLCSWRGCAKLLCAPGRCPTHGR